MSPGWGRDSGGCFLQVSWTSRNSPAPHWFSERWQYSESGFQMIESDASLLVGASVAAVVPSFLPELEDGRAQHPPVAHRHGDVGGGDHVVLGRAGFPRVAEAWVVGATGSPARTTRTARARRIDSLSAVR